MQNPSHPESLLSSLGGRRNRQSPHQGFLRTTTPLTLASRNRVDDAALDHGTPFDNLVIFLHPRRYVKAVVHQLRLRRHARQSNIRRKTRMECPEGGRTGSSKSIRAGHSKGCPGGTLERMPEWEVREGVQMGQLKGSPGRTPGVKPRWDNRSRIKTGHPERNPSGTPRARSG